MPIPLFDAPTSPPPPMQPSIEPALMKSIREVEALGAAAWSPDVVEEFDGWRLRFSGGATRRANSVWPSADVSRLPLEGKLGHVEQAYSCRGLRPCYQISPGAQPAELDLALERRGYEQVAPTCTQVARITDLLDHLELRSPFTARVSEQFDEQWFATYCQAEQVTQGSAAERRRILQRCQTPSAYVLALLDDEPVATGWGVASAGWVGLFSIATRLEFRRQGAASAVLRGLASWGQSHGANQAYLQVLVGNQAARALYTRAGFQTLYRYHYRVAPDELH